MVSSYIMNGALVAGLVPGFIGINGLIRPDFVLNKVSFPIPTEPEAKKLIHTLTRLFAIRNISVSFLIATVWTTGNPRLLGTAMGGALFVCVSDGFVSRSWVKGRETQHWGVVPIIIGLMAGLFGAF
ncbi:hypothetical protein VHEMI05175 [[Torrubiella] hemipterigena]|uniref:Integral membrane protein n=1 Tax=[Torrubiella] hemipterigena TaxID=1531966 RepID=A0A0A1SX98_9HYPO|nr:hypothetical protein VHEMI05175 [[Torrubiella] hemipterigena]